MCPQLVHLDVKSANVLLSADGENAKLADFGLAQCMKGLSSDKNAYAKGTAGWLAPEASTLIDIA